MRLDRWATLYVAQPLRAARFAQNPPSGCVPMLMYHSITETVEDVPAYYRTTTSPAVFAQQMDWLAAEGWRGVSVSDALEILGQKSAEKVVAITFDDGFADFAEQAMPALRKHRFDATMYLPTAYMDGKPFKGRKCLSWEACRDLQEEGIEFGSHTVNHPFLVRLTWPEIVAEVRDSKLEIEQRLGRSVKAFAYPYAFPQNKHEFSDRFRETLRTCGYESCVTTEIGRVRAGDDPFCLKRLPANSCDDAELLKAKLEGAYDWLRWPQSAVKSIKAALRS